MERILTVFFWFVLANIVFGALGFGISFLWNATIAKFGIPSYEWWYPNLAVGLCAEWVILYIFGTGD